MIAAVTLVIPYTSADWATVVPAFAVAATALVVLVADLLVPRRSRRLVSILLGILGLAASGANAALQWGHPVVAFGGAFVTGGFTLVFEEIVLLAAALTLLLCYRLGREDQSASGIALLLWSASGAMLMAGAGNLLMVFLGLELLSLALYCLCGLASRGGAREAALKYLILSSTATGFMLYGMALLFGATGSVSLAALAGPTVSQPLYIFGAGLFLIGLAFKLSLAPFHVWTPDVYEGAPLPVTAFMSIVTKAGALAVFARFAYAALGSHLAPAVLAPMWAVAALSMIVGNVGALAQTDMKRLLAYSGIAQLGYVITALAGTTPLGMRYAIFYLAAYTFMNLGAFAVVALLSREHEEGSHLGAYAGLGYRRPLLAAAMTVFLLALAGLPPTAGFTAKILILASSVAAGYAWLAAFLIIGTAISIYVYLKVVWTM
ncbi:MAG: NADH-quinone oxidoreductase subunit N, partial [Candidatus Eremiobacteraeota bacterium]|nr:NADH-quinone oxidoreductase subunit N [Candidatus Eremiobacteraeota bacterium]